MMAEALLHAGHNSDHALDGPSALLKAMSRRPDVILIDLAMPDMDGVALARRVRDEPTLANVKLIAVTGWSDEKNQTRAREAGFDVYLMKPVNLNELLASLTAAT